MDERRIEGLRWKLGLTNLVVKDWRGRVVDLRSFGRRLIFSFEVFLTFTSMLMWWRGMGLCGGLQVSMVNLKPITKNCLGRHSEH
jgi:hypothetical protein